MRAALHCLGMDLRERVIDLGAVWPHEDKAVVAYLGELADRLRKRGRDRQPRKRHVGHGR